MKHFSTHLLLIFFSCTSLIAQDESCDGTRYRDVVFDFIDKTFNVKFGENTTMGGDFQELYMDIYEPLGDDLTNRPLVVLVFGGAFILGERDDMEFLAEDFAARGYVTATVDYRLATFELMPDSVAVADEVVKALGDVKAAIRFLREDALNDNNYGINPDLIMVGGISAGAIVSTHLAYMDENDEIPPYLLDIIEQNGGWEGNSSDNTQISSEVQGVLNYSGSITRSSWLNEGSAPLFSVHDDGDGIVPFDAQLYQSVSGAVVYAEGSGAMHEVADANGIRNELIVVPNSAGHVTYFVGASSISLDSVITGSVDFLFDIVCEGFISSTSTVAETDLFQISPNPVSDELRIRLNQGINDYAITIYNASGEIVFEQNDRQNELRINASAFPTGFYWVSINDNQSGQFTTQKVVIAR